MPAAAGKLNPVEADEREKDKKVIVHPSLNHYVTSRFLNF